MNYTLSKIDQQRFGVITAKAFLENGDNVLELIEKSQVDLVEFLIVRVPTNQLGVVQLLEQEGFFLADTLVYYLKKRIEHYPDVLPEGYLMRLATPEDADSVERLALETFHGYQGHYHADPKLKKEDCDLVYSSWAANSCREKNVADAVILVEKNQELAAFATIKVNGQHEIEGVLFGVSPNHRNKNLYLSLMNLSQNWGAHNNFRQMIVSTQITNTVVQKYWCRLGFEPNKSYYTFHKWFKCAES